MASRSAAEGGTGTTPLGEAAAAWAATRRVRVGRWSVRYREAGSGPAVALVHGLGISADYWFRNAPALAAAGYRVLAPDLPGFGRTEGPSEGLSVSGQARAGLAWAEAVGLGPAVFVGHSISCATVLEMARVAPGAVRGLILAAPTEAGGAGTMLRQAWRLFLDAWRERPELLLLATQTYLQAGPVRYWHTWRWGMERDPSALAAAVAQPTLVVLGAADPVVPRDFAERVAGALPDGRLVVLPEATHAVSFDQPDEFNRLALDFLARVYGR